MSKLEDKIKGVVCLFGETGYEGSMWAFNDPKFNYENKSHYVCKKCHRFWDKEKYPKEVENIEGDYCEPKDHDFKLTPEIYWSYEGLHILRNGDYLRVYDKEDSSSILWEGEIKFKIAPVKFIFYGKEVETTRYEFESENATYANFANWFNEEYPAELIKKPYENPHDTNL